MRVAEKIEKLMVVYGWDCPVDDVEVQRNSFILELLKILEREESVKKRE